MDRKLYSAIVLFVTVVVFAIVFYDQIKDGVIQELKILAFAIVIAFLILKFVPEIIQSIENGGGSGE